MILPWKEIALALLVFAAGYGTKGWLERQSDEDQAVALQAQWQGYAATTTAAQKAEAERIIAAVAARNPEREAQSRTIDAILKEVRNAPKTTQCADSPAVRIALDRLRALQAARSGDLDAAPPARNVPVPPGPGAP